MPAAVAQGPHEQRRQLLVEAVLAGEEVDDVAVPALFEQQRGVADGEGAPALLGAAPGLGEAGGVEPEERRAPPRGAGVLVGGEVPAAQGGVGETAERQDVDGVAPEVQRVQPAARGDPRLGAVAQPRAEAGQRDLEGGAGVLRQVLAPRLVDERVAVDGLARVEGEDREEGREGAAAVRLRHPVAHHGHAAEQAQADRRHPSPRTSRHVITSRKGTSSEVTRRAAVWTNRSPERRGWWGVSRRHRASCTRNASEIEASPDPVIASG